VLKAIKLLSVNCCPVQTRDASKKRGRRSMTSMLLYRVIAYFMVNC